MTQNFRRNFCSDPDYSYDYRRMDVGKGTGEEYIVGVVFVDYLRVLEGAKSSVWSPFRTLGDSWYARYSTI